MTDTTIDTPVFETIFGARPITQSELLMAAAILNSAELWQNVKAYTDAFYGPTVARAKIKWESEYDDEGGYYPSITDVIVYDAEGNHLTMDFSGEKWETARTQELLEAGEGRVAYIAEGTTMTRRQCEVANTVRKEKKPELPPFYTAEEIEERVAATAALYGRILDRQVEFWAEYDAEPDADTRADMLEEYFQDEISDARSAINFEKDDPTEFDLTKVPSFEGYQIYIVGTINPADEVAHN